MSGQLIAHSPDLLRLAEEGYELGFRAGGAVLTVSHVPYVTAGVEVKCGTIVCPLTLAGDATVTPDTHTVYFIGEAPCDEHGRVLNVVHSTARQTVAEDIEVDHMFSSKPAPTAEAPAGYPDHYEKITSYVSVLLGPAQVLNPEVSPQTFRGGGEAAEDSVFAYAENASIRAGITTVSAKLVIDKVAIVGLGGTGSYILDLLAKTPIRELHLFDGDRFLQHNAFRSPGAATVDQLRQLLPKVTYLRNLYSAMRSGIIAYEEPITGDNVDVLRDMNFVFLALDHGPSRKLIIERLEAWEKSFIDVGMGLGVTGDDSIEGLARVTTSTPGHRRHVWESGQIQFGEPDPDNVYDHNVQVADMNMINAALAVIRFKKLQGFYVDLETEHTSFYGIDVNDIVNDDCAQ